MDRKEACAYWKNGIFCIILKREPRARNFQDVVIGIDPGSKRTGITVATGSGVVCNQLFDTPRWVKKNMEQRRMCRRCRRSRKTPYRKSRYNRAVGGVPPSTKSRWGAHLRVIDFWKKLVPLKIVSIEDVKAVTKTNCQKWNREFSPLQRGKTWFSEEIHKREYAFYTFLGYETSSQRSYRGFKKTTKKLEDIWGAHNVDSHCLCELAIGNIEPFFGILKCELFQWHRRQIHTVNFSGGGFRRIFGMTRSLGLNRGALVNHFKHGLTYVGGTSKGRLSLYEIKTGKRLAQNVKLEDCEVLTNLRWRSHACCDGVSSV